MMLVLGPLRVSGSSSVPPKGGLLILSNHIADIDPPVVGIACRRRIHFMAKSELFEIPILKHVIRWFQAFPVKRGAPDKAAIRHAIDLLQAGEVVCIFPEGQLSEDSLLQPLLPGAALIVRKAGVPVVCCGLRNTNRVMPYRTVFPRPAWCFTYAKWGEARTFDKGESAEEILAWADGQLRALTGQ
ncbi:MAG TPA: lysophospholipid acyltransferase family protein [Fimbriimonadaceae bacterium]|nr:lysophospholipid acyltransferase family protein [Fimbriimonadaceae bacterium]